jgi:hypothetical protein
MMTFKQLKYGPVSRIAGVVVPSDQFTAYCNNAVRMLMNRGNFWATVQPMLGCVRENVITWPRSVGTVLALDACNRPSQLSNHWYQFMPLDSAHIRNACHFDQHGWAGGLMTESFKTSPVFNPIITDGMNLRFYIREPSDVGKTITVFGIDANGQIIRGEREDGTFQDGLVLTLANPYVQTPYTIRHVTRILKDETNGWVDGYQFSVAGNLFVDLAHYEPTETHPEYIVTRITGNRQHGYDGHTRNSNVSPCVAQISALVKLKFVPFKFDDDLVQIDCEDAIADMYQGILYKEQGNLTAATQYEIQALRELNKQMQDKFGLEQFQVSYRQYGSARMQKVTNGFI